MYEGAREKAAAEIQERAWLYSESRVYRLSNQYLNERQKVDVQMWFGAPVELFYIGVGSLMLLKQPLLPAVIISSVFSIAFMEFFFWNAKEALDNRAEPRDNASVIAGGDWVHGRQAARIR
jgi:hypothetical protein